MNEKMNKPTLVVMAAGMGSRYGGLKQIDPVGSHGELIIDYSIYDALQAGFGKVVFVIQKSIEADFREMIGNRIDRLCETAYVFQEIDFLPAGFQLPDGRTKPWGTGHAVLLCQGHIRGPFAVINADDFYGRKSFQSICDQLLAVQAQDDRYEFCMVGYPLAKTITDSGHVSRGVCKTNRDGYLIDIEEFTQIKKVGGGAKYLNQNGAWADISLDTIVSMNMWGFTPAIFEALNSSFSDFLTSINGSQKTEFFLPSVVSDLLSRQKASVKIIPTEEQWVGVTYKNDKEFVEKHIATLIERGVYPEKLW